MIDLITLIQTVPKSEVESITIKNRLQTNTKGGVLYYDNVNEKFKHAYYLKIETKPVFKIKLECSLNKYYSHVTTGKQTNFDLFSFSNVISTIKILSEKTGIDLLNMKVTYFEIGLNLYMKNDCIEYINNMISIGAIDTKKALFVNPKYKEERIKTTVFHRDKKKVYKVYDKVFEMFDKNRTDAPPNLPNILRIETTYRRIEKTTLNDLLQPERIKKLTEQFLKDWRTVQFELIMQAPKGLHVSKLDLCKEILKHGKDKVLKTEKDKLKEGKITPKIYRGLREFINTDWEQVKKEIQFLRTEKEYEFREALYKALKITNN